MLEALLTYKLTLLAGFMAGTALSFTGSQLASRGQAVQTLVISQSAVLGVILGILFNEHFSWAPEILSFVVAGLGYLLCEYLSQRKFVSKNTHFIGVFIILLSTSYILTALAPKLESHMATTFFGDFAVTTNKQSILIIVFSAVALVFQCYFWKPITALSFKNTLFGKALNSNRENFIQVIFALLSFFLIILSVQFLGLLFTLACLFLPSLALTRVRSGLDYFKLKLFMIVVFGIFLGFVGSLIDAKLPTVPCIVLALLFVSIMAQKCHGRWH